MTDIPPYELPPRPDNDLGIPAWSPDLLGQINPHSDINAPIGATYGDPEVFYQGVALAGEGLTPTYNVTAGPIPRYSPYELALQARGKEILDSANANREIQELLRQAANSRISQLEGEGLNDEQMLEKVQAEIDAALAERATFADREAITGSSLKKERESNLGELSSARKAKAILSERLGLKIPPTDLWSLLSNDS